MRCRVSTSHLEALALEEALTAVCTWALAPSRPTGARVRRVGLPLGAS